MGLETSHSVLRRYKHLSLRLSALAPTSALAMAMSTGTLVKAFMQVLAALFINTYTARSTETVVGRKAVALSRDSSGERLESTAFRARMQYWQAFVQVEACSKLVYPTEMRSASSSQRCPNA